MRKALFGLVIVPATLIPASMSAAQEDQECHPSYDPCVPIASDVDCASGTGDGPVFIDYPVTVVGPDEYGLDADGDGVGCQNETGTGPPLPTAEEMPPEPEPEPAAPALAVEDEPSFTG